MNKLLTYFRYFLDYMKFGDLGSVVASFRYIISKKSHSSDRVIRTSAGTFYCRKNTNDFQFANYYYEWGVKKYLLDHHKEYTVFIDGGACVGGYSILMARLGLRTIAFEPVQFNFDVLVKNLELNKLTSKVEAFPIGLGDKSFAADFVFNPVNTGASHIAAANETSNCTVDISAFDSIYPTLGIKKEDRILVKLDVEGMEPLALLGAEQFIRTFPNLTFVLEDKHSGEDSIKDSLNRFASFDYGIVDEFNIFAKKYNRNS